MRRLNLGNMLSKAAVFVLLFFCFSCSRYIKTPRAISDTSALQTLVSERYDYVKNKNFKLKFNTVVTFDGQDNKLSGKIIVSSDSCISINIISSVIGVEVARFRFTSDSLLFINKAEKCYYLGGYEDLVKYFDIDYRSLFSIFSSSYIRSDSIDFNEKKAHYLDDYKSFLVTDLFYAGGLKSIVTTQFGQFGYIEKIELISSSGNVLRVNYSNFVNKYNFPSKMEFSTTLNKEKINIELSIVDVEIIKNEVSASKISFLSNYKRINL